MPNMLITNREYDMKTAIQLYTLREGLMENLPTILAELKAMGYDGAEIPSFADEDVDRIIDEMNKAGLEIFSLHINLADFDAWTDEKLAKYAAAGCRLMPICWMPENCLAGGEQYAETREKITAFSARAAKYGISILYHNHDFDLAPCGDTTKLDVLYGDMPAHVLDAELDTCWVYTAGYDPLTYFRRYSDRCPILHLKDCVKEGGHKGFRAVGDGALEFAPIIEAARAAGTPWLCVEQDLPTEGKTAMECARDSITYLKTLL